MQKVFSNGSSHDTRDILIKISDDFIEFFFYEQYLRHQEWVMNETERRLECNEEDLTEDEATNHNFYWFGKSDWVRDKTQRLDKGCSSYSDVLVLDEGIEWVKIGRKKYK